MTLVCRPTRLIPRHPFTGGIILAWSCLHSRIDMTGAGMTKVKPIAQWPWWGHMILSTFSAISIITGGVLAVQSWADIFPLTTKGWVEGYITKELIPVLDAQAMANGRTTQVQSDLSSLTIQTLNFQILQMQIQLGPLQEKDGSMSIDERQLAERLKREIDNAKSMLAHAQCVQANEIRITQIPCP